MVNTGRTKISLFLFFRKKSYRPTLGPKNGQNQETTTLASKPGVDPKNALIGTTSGQGTKSYGFTYDGAHRLTDGQYYSGATNSLQSSYNLLNLPAQIV